MLSVGAVVMVGMKNGRCCLKCFSRDARLSSSVNSHSSSHASFNKYSEACAVREALNRSLTGAISFNA
jgi:hypothetical protein